MVILTCMPRAQMISPNHMNNELGLLHIKLGPSLLISLHLTFLQDIDIDILQQSMYGVEAQLDEVASNISATDLIYLKYQITFAQ